jgi:hypothetical protein
MEHKLRAATSHRQVNVEVDGAIFTGSYMFDGEYVHVVRKGIAERALVGDEPEETAKMLLAALVRTAG